MASLAATGGYFMISVGLYVILSRWIVGNGVLKFVFCGTIAGVGLVLRQWLSVDLSNLVPSVLLYAFICELFIFFIAFVGSSVSVSLLLMLKGRPLSQPEIDRLYADEAMVDERIRKLEMTDFLEKAADPRKLTAKGRVLLSVFRMFRRFFRHEGPERTL